MTKTQKIESLASAMKQSTRGASKDGMLVAGGEQFYHFSDTAPKSLVSKFLEHYNVDDLDYEMFSVACDIVSDVLTVDGISDEKATGEIYERSSDSASVYTSTRLAYLNNNNEGEISDTMKEYGESSIATACAIWYDKQVEEMAIIIKDWVNACNYESEDSNLCLTHNKEH